MKSDEILDVAKLQALELQEIEFKPHRNMRSPHHSSTLASVFGGGCHFQQTLLHSTKLCYNYFTVNNASP